MKTLSGIGSALDGLGLMGLAGTTVLATGLADHGWGAIVPEATILGLLGGTLALSVLAFGLARVLQLWQVVKAAPERRAVCRPDAASVSTPVTEVFDSAPDSNASQEQFPRVA